MMRFTEIRLYLIYAVARKSIKRTYFGQFIRMQLLFKCILYWCGYGRWNLPCFLLEKDDSNRAIVCADQRTSSPFFNHHVLFFTHRSHPFRVVAWREKICKTQMIGAFFVTLSSLQMSPKSKKIYEPILRKCNFKIFTL